MVLNTITVGAAVTPTVVKTYATHYLDGKTRKELPTSHITYDEGLALIRRFLYYASLHTVEELQAFTSQWVPSPRWVKVEEAIISEKSIADGATALIAQLGRKGIDKIGGKTWWQWRRENTKLKAEWIEMRSDYEERKRINDKGKRIMLYVHGGAYFFGSVDEHRYQMQRHARKLKARVFARCVSEGAEVVAARYRLAPQFPFPCGLLDCLAAYLFLLETRDPSTIILAGDSAGGGMVLSILVILRDQGIRLPAGVILISPWVDLTHSFPSVAEENNPHDYIPTHGFLQRPSRAWPPPNTDDMQHISQLAIAKAVKESMPRRSTQQEKREAVDAALHDINMVDGASEEDDQEKNKRQADASTNNDPKPAPPVPGAHSLSIELDGKLIEIKDQIQLYASNELISHPLVSPALQPSLGGLPPLLILTGGGEILRDEQIYVAHKAANPSKYPPSDASLAEHPEAREEIGKWKPTDVQLQVWDNLCHVAPTLSFTRPAKFMYRSIAQFGAWALARAQKTEIEILDDDAISIISTMSDDGSDNRSEAEKPLKDNAAKQNGNEIARSGTVYTKQVGKAGDPLPSFRNHMIRQRVDRKGCIFPLQSSDTLPALNMSPNEIGVIKPGPVRKWMAAKHTWDIKFAKEKRAVQKRRIKEMVRGYQGFGDEEIPPPSALAGRRKLDYTGKEEKKKRSWGMTLWTFWGSRHDEKTIFREEKLSHTPETSTADPATSGTNVDGPSDANTMPVQNSSVPTVSSPQSRPGPAQSRSRSRHRVVTDLGQTNGDINENTTAAELLALREQYASVTSLGSEGVDARVTVPSTDNSPASETHPAAQHRNHPESLSSGEFLPSPGLLSPHTILAPRAPLSPMSQEPEPQGFEGRKTTPNRPTANGVAFPFKLRLPGEANASTCTLVGTPGLQEGAEGKQLGAGDGNVGSSMPDGKAEESNEVGKALENEASSEDERGRNREEIHTPMTAVAGETVEAIGEDSTGKEMPALKEQFASGVDDAEAIKPNEKVGRPEFERFETAREM